MTTPTIIGRYEVESLLGEGGMAKVYLARDPFMDRQVAIKVLSNQLIDDELLQKHIKHEAQVIARLEHPCIVPIFDFGLHGERPYIVMRYMAAGGLEERLKGGDLGLNHLSRILERVAKALDGAHEKGVIHRDVKPSNILFGDDGQAYLSDFGLAKSVHRPSGTTGGFFVGTPEYMSPEQVQNMAIDGRSDIYSLGVILFLALSGRLPFENESPLALALAHATEQPPDLLSLKPNLSENWRDIVNKALAKQPDDRYNKATDLARDIRELVSGRWYLRKLMDD